MSNLEQGNSYYDSWQFIVENLPNYYHRDDVLRDDILLRFVEGDEVCEDDLEWIAKEFQSDKQLVKEELVRIETGFAKEALQTFYCI